MKPRHFPLFILALLITYALHEGAHWLAGEMLGYDMWVNINSAGLARGSYQTRWHQEFVSFAGPFITVLQGVIAFLVLRKGKAMTAFAFLFSALMMRFVAMLMSFNHPNDEARVSEWLGLGHWTLHIGVVLILLGLTLKGGSYLKLGWRSYLFAYLTVSLATAVVVMGEPFLPNFNPYN